VIAIGCPPQSQSLPGTVEPDMLKSEENRFSVLAAILLNDNGKDNVI
jgi:hypothetical protein